jgi:hypothetical protein
MELPGLVPGNSIKSFFETFYRRQIMKKQIAILLAVGMVVALAGTAQAEVVLDFNLGNSSNDDIPSAYGSNLAGAPNVALTWISTNSQGWEHHTSGQWDMLEGKDGATSPVDIAQIDNLISGAQQPTGTPVKEILFTVDAGWIFKLNTWDMGHAGDQNEADYSWDLKLIKESDSSVVWSTTTSEMGADDTTTISPNFTGEAGEDYRLSFVENGSTFTQRGAIDNLSFGQAVPEPATMSLLALGGLSLLRRRRRS